MSQQELKALPCPFCGGTPTVVSKGSFITDVFTVECPECKCVGPDFHAKRYGSLYEVREQQEHATFAAITAWNQRSPSPDQEAARLREAAKRLWRASRRVISAFILCRKEWPEEKRLTAPEFDARLQEWEDAQAALAPPSQEG